MPKRQPNSKHCFICGMENPVGLHLVFDEIRPGEVEAQIVVEEKYQGYPGIVHGGIVAAMLDEVSGRAFMGDNQAPRFMYTARLNVRYRKHVPVRQPLRLYGRAGNDRGRTATSYAAIYNQQGEVLAECDSLLVDVPAEDYQDVDLKALGWKVYDEERS